MISLNSTFNENYSQNQCDDLIELAAQIGGLV